MPDPKKKKSILTSNDRNIFNTKPLSDKKRQAYIKEEVGKKPKNKPQLSDMPASVRIPNTPLKKIKEKKTGETYSSKKAMIKHEKSESKAYEKKEYKEGKKSPLKFAGNMFAGMNPFSNKKNGMYDSVSTITGSALDSLKNVINPKNTMVPNSVSGSKSPFRKTSTTKKTK